MIPLHHAPLSSEEIVSLLFTENTPASLCARTSKEIVSLLHTKHPASLEGGRLSTMEKCKALLGPKTCEDFGPPQIRLRANMEKHRHRGLRSDMETTFGRVTGTPHQLAVWSSGMILRVREVLGSIPRTALATAKKAWLLSKNTQHLCVPGLLFSCTWPHWGLSPALPLDGLGDGCPAHQKHPASLYARTPLLLHMDTLGIEPRAFRMRSGCDTTTPCALE